MDPIRIPDPRFSVGNRLQEHWNEDMVRALRELVEAVETLEFPSTVYPPDIPPDTPDAMDDEFTEATLDAKWTLDNPGTPSDHIVATVGDSFLRLVCQGHASTDIHSLVQACPSGDWTYRLKLHHDYSERAAGYQASGLVILNTTSGRLFTVELMTHSSGTQVLRSIIWLDYTTASGTITTATIDAHSPIYIELEKVSDTMTARWSLSGFDEGFHDLYSGSVANAMFPQSVPDFVGVAMWGTNGIEHTAVCDWFRRVA